jgi:AraC-like DNA-binding protein
MAPKRFSRVRRFQEVLDRLGPERHVNWAEIAVACGYSDHAHLTGDFHEFAGVSPSVYLCERDARFPTYIPYAQDMLPDLQAAGLHLPP